MTRRDLLAQKYTPRRTRLVGLASSDVVSVAPDASLVDALQLMANENINHLTVIDGG